MKLRLHRIFICQAFAMLRNVQQRKLRLSPFEQHGVPFTLVVAESDIFPVNVPVASLQLSDQFAFGYLPAPQKPVWTDIVGERGKEQLSQLHYYPNQRGIYPVKQIIIRDYSWDNNLIVQSNFVEFLLLQTKGSCKRFFDFGCFVMLFNVFCSGIIHYGKSLDHLFFGYADILHGRFDTFMSEQPLDLYDVHTIFQPVCRPCMPQAMTMEFVRYHW